MEKFELKLKGLESVEQKLDYLIEAIKKIEDGSYGTCSMCGVTIPIGRLKAKPFAKFCTECREVFEREEANKK